MPGIDDLQHDDLRDEIKRVFLSCRGSKSVAAAIGPAETRLAVVGALMRIMGKTPPEAIDDERLEKTIVLAGMALNRMQDHGPRLAEMTEMVARAVESSRPGAAPAATSQSNSQSNSPSQARPPILAPAPSPPPDAPRPRVQTPPPVAVAATPVKKDAASVFVAAARPLVIDGMQPIRMFPEAKPDRGRRSISELMAPSPGGDAPRKDIAAWVGGRPWSPDVFVFRLQPRDEDLAEEMAEFEAEMHAAPKVVLSRPGVRPTLGDEDIQRDKEWLHYVARDMGVYAMTTHRVARPFVDALEKVIAAESPDHVPALAAFDAHVVLGEDLVYALAEAWDIEQFYLRETGPCEGRPQNLRGSIAPEGELREGLCFERAIFMHLALGKPLAPSLREAVTELRFAQVIRGVSREEETAAIARFDKVFSRDCADPLDAYRMNPEKNETTSLDAPGY